MNGLEWFLVFLIVGCVGAILFMIVFKKNRFKVRVRLITGTKRLIIDDKGVEWKNDKKVTYVKLKKMKELIPMPPSDSIDIGKRGEKIIEVYRDEDGNYAFLKDNGHVKFFEPMDTEMKVLLADQVIKGNSRNNGWQQYLPVYVSLGFVVVLILGGMMLIGEPIKALEEYTSGVVGATNSGLDTLNSILEHQIELEQDIQIIKAQTGAEAIENPPN